MKIAIFTFHRAYNCGAMLQAWALQTVLERMGHNVSFPKCNCVGEVRRWQEWFNPRSRGWSRLRSIVYRSLANLLSIPVTGLSQSRYRAFRRKYLHESEFNSNSVSTRYDLLVYGSDQIWRRSHYIDSELDVFFLRNGFGANVKKIAYAASCDDKPLTGEERELLKEAIPMFDAVSVREQFLSIQLETMMPGRTFPVVLDPTLLLTASDYISFDCGCAPRGDYVFAYVLHATPFVVATAKEIARRLGLPLILTPVYHGYSLLDTPGGFKYGTSPDRLVAYIAHARYVLSQSFHGTVFSVIFGKQFLDLDNRENSFGTRSGALLSQIGLAKRMVNPAHNIEDILQRLTSPLGGAAQKKLCILRQKSLSWLEEALGSVEK